MRRLMLVAMLLAVAGIAQAQEARDTTLIYADVELRISQVELGDFPVVRAFVAVTDSQGFPRTKLAPENFIVTENSVLRDGVRFANRDDLDLPLSIVFVVDTSGSMQNAIEQELTAIRQFVGQLSPDDRVGLVTFSDAPFPMVRLTNEHGLLLRELDFIAAGGQTAMWDGVLLGVDELLRDTTPSRRALVLLSDGLDNRSVRAPAEIIQKYEEEALPMNMAFTIYALGLGEEIDRASLNKLAGRTGGLYYDSPTAADLAKVYEDILNQIQSEYLLEWNVPGEREEGQIVSLTIDATGVHNSTPAEHTYRSPGLSAALARAILPGIVTIGAMLLILIIATIFKATRTTWLKVMITPLEGKDYRLGGDSVEIGSTEACGVRLARDPAMLPVHATLKETGNGWEISVTDPASPLFYAGEMLAKKLLRDGDSFLLGNTQLVFRERVNRPGVTAADQVFAEDIAVLTEPEALTEETMLAAGTQEPAEPVKRELPVKLVALSGALAGKSFSLQEGTTAIGRSQGELTIPEDNQVSRSHCSLMLSVTEATLTDQGSTNGTWLNGNKLAPHQAEPVYAGDLLRIGDGEYRLD